ncbi:ATP-binding cassette domain-containing protein [Enterococcus faecium]|uniref:ATP-binding cassette domain-containing protein n=1 Tax=Enterococcus TaxID=1350 RepID=UPI000813A907|nr:MULTISPECIES: ATP-binding cassette domain-containing protein [Enterococcus]AWX47062.1 ATP-binding cassette domain-containing protein [Enterococcus faecium]EGP4714954.1 ATP-binding cassette domain-containing protein [Enterococcus faecium]EGP4724159.1 ATP-binding cassette domain-containing protein [Enterococcus faecium]EGP4811226.1 ATP-binding cassette domain-containing protein [Enterococcus faecium]EGP5039907.1 ATP-binding cassette domain-containing protein [Enterococcus faecium]
MCREVLKTKDLVKQIEGVLVLDKVNMSISQGDIYGFIGNNGAGKTTFMRTITGLVKYNSGEIKLFGKSFPLNRHSLQKIGALIENPVFFPELTAYDNLKYFSLLTNRNVENIDHILALMNLDKVGKKKVKNFSLGMKQRLGIAIALIPDPELIILDEPLNGLDPQGIQDIRNLILKLNQEHGITFLISSHILSELEQVATKYGIMHEGRLIEEFSISEYVDLGFTGFTIESSKPLDTLQFLKQHFPKNQITFDAQKEISIDLASDEEERLQTMLDQEMKNSFFLKRNVMDMEKYFLHRVEAVK